MTDFVILGFLMYGPKSGYDIKKLMSLSTAHFYETSYGSIYPSLERMEKAGLVHAERSEGSGRLRRVFELREAGRQAFLEWLVSPLDIKKGPSQLLARLFFLGCLPTAEARKAIKGFGKAASARRALVAGAIENLPLEPDFFQASTQRFGLDYYAFLESWLGGLSAEAANWKAKEES
jgi:DNA-binding PadR family transcriptional regulator